MRSMSVVTHPRPVADLERSSDFVPRRRTQPRGPPERRLLEQTVRRAPLHDARELPFLTALPAQGHVLQ